MKVALVIVTLITRIIVVVAVLAVAAALVKDGFVQSVRLLCWVERNKVEKVHVWTLASAMVLKVERVLLR